MTTHSMKRVMGVAALLAAVVGVGPTGAQQRAAPPTVVKTGPQIFNETCVSCHGGGLAGTPKARSAFGEAVLAKDDATLQRAIADGPAGAPGHAFKSTLSENQIWQLVVHMRLTGLHLKGRPAYVDPADRVVRSRKQAFRIEVVARGLETPWGLAFLPGGRMLVTERAGRLRFIGKGGAVSEPVKGTPKVWVRQDSGLLDMALHPDYARNGWIYLAYVEAVPGYAPPPSTPGVRIPSPPNMTVLVRGRINAHNEWVDEQVIYRAPSALYTTSGAHYGTRFLFDGKGRLFFSLGERGAPANAQKLDNPLGKIHRVNDDGSIPADNPFVGVPGAVASIWSYGHRNPEGLAWDPLTGDLWESEHGPTGGDEINVIVKGGNYGWGVATMGIQPGITETHVDGMVDPVAWYVPTLAPSGINFYTGGKYPGWKNNLFVGGLYGQQLRRLEVKAGKVIAQEVLYDQHGRNRTVAQGPDGYLYVLQTVATGPGTGLGVVDSAPGAVLRLVPVE